MKLQPAVGKHFVCWPPTFDVGVRCSPWSYPRRLGWRWYTGSRPILDMWYAHLLHTINTSFWIAVGFKKIKFFKIAMSILGQCLQLSSSWVRPRKPRWGSDGSSSCWQPSWKGFCKFHAQKRSISVFKKLIGPSFLSRREAHEITGNEIIYCFEVWHQAYAEKA